MYSTPSNVKDTRTKKLKKSAQMSEIRINYLKSKENEKQM